MFVSGEDLCSGKYVALGDQVNSTFEGRFKIDSNVSCKQRTVVKVCGIVALYLCCAVFVSQNMYHLQKDVFQRLDID